MKAVNLIPGDGRKGSRGGSRGALGPGHLAVALLVAALALVTVAVLTGNTISERKARIASLELQLTATQAQAARLAEYTSFQRVAQARAQTVRQIAATRFDWHSALSDLSRVVPADTSLNWLYGSVAPAATISGTGSGSSGIASALRADLSVPAFEVNGCTKTQDDVARLISRLRLINGVTRVTLGDSQKPDVAQGSPSTGGAATAQRAQDCGPDTPTFDLVVFFKQLPGGGAAAVASSPPASAQAAPAVPASSSPSATPVTTPVTGGKP